MNIGQKVWYVPQRGYSTRAPGREVQVIKIARKYIYLHDEDHLWLELKIDRDQIDASQRGYIARDKRNDCVGRVFVDRQHESYAADRERAWEKLARAFRTTAPDHVTLKDIKAMAITMEVDLSESASV